MAGQDTYGSWPLLMSRPEADEAIINDLGDAIMHLTRALKRNHLAPAKAIVLDHDTYCRLKLTNLPFDVRGGQPSMTIAGVSLVEE